MDCMSYDVDRSRKSSKLPYNWFVYCTRREIECDTQTADTLICLFVTPKQQKHTNYIGYTVKNKIQYTIKTIKQCQRMSFACCLVLNVTDSHVQTFTSYLVATDKMSQ